MMVKSPVGYSADELVAQLEGCFSDWWNIHLLYSLETLKVFRAWGDDDKQLLTWAMAIDFMDGRQSPLTLSEIATRSGVPLETARRNLLSMLDADGCQKSESGYQIHLTPDVRKTLETLAVTFTRALSTALPRFGMDPSRASKAAFLQGGLCYVSNLRRLAAKGSFLASVVAGMIEVDSWVRLHLLRAGEKTLSRIEYNKRTIEVKDCTFHMTKLAALAGESVERVRQAMQHGARSGVIILHEHDLCSYDATATRVPGDAQAYTRGVKEALAALILDAAKVGSADAASFRSS